MDHGKTPPRNSARPAELDRLFHRYEEAVRDGVRVVLLEGPPDAGPGRLVRELRARVGLDAPMIEGACDPGRPFSAFAELVTAALGMLRQLGVTPMLDRDTLGCGHGCHELWYQHRGPLPAAASAPSPDRRLRFFESIRRVLTQLGVHRAPIISVRRLERADRGTVELMAFLAEAPAPWDATNQREAGTLHALIVATVEETGPSATWEGAPLAELLRQPTTSTMRIGPLDRAGVGRYLATDDVIESVWQRTAGLPGRIDRLLDTDLPPMEAAVEAAIGAHNPTTQALFRALAMLGGPAGLDELERIVPSPVGSAAMAEFSRSNLLVRSIADGRTLFDFAEPRAGSIVRRTLTDQERREHHHRCAELCATTPGREVEAARHALRGGDPDRAAELALEAWPMWMAAHAYSTAAQLLEGLVEAGPRSVHDLRSRLVDLYRLTGDTDRALDHARLLFRADADSAACALVVGELLARQADLEGATSTMERAKELAEQADDGVTLGEVLVAMARLSLRRHELPAARELAEQCLKAAPADDLPLILDAEDVLAQLALLEGSGDDARTMWREVLAKAERADLIRHQVRALTGLGMADAAAGHHAAAEHSLARALILGGEASRESDQAAPLEAMAVLAQERTDYRAAQRCFHQAARIRRAGGEPERLGLGMFLLARLYAELGDPYRGRRLCAHAWDSTPVQRFPAIAATGASVEGEVELSLGNTDRARRSFTRAAELGARHGLGEIAFAARLGLARVALDNGDVAAARQALVLAGEPKTPRQEAERALVEADLARSAGGGARVKAVAALKAAEDLSDLQLCLLARLRVARAWLDEGRAQEAMNVLQRARQIDDEVASRVPEECRDLYAERAVAERLRSLEAEAGLTSASIPPPPPTSAPANPVDERPLDAIVGTSIPIQRIKTLIARIAPSDATVLVRGESGTGKELVAEALHRLSGRAQGPFIRVNCAAVVETLLASELFGHERGAFTGAHARKKGWFEAADGGTLFLDEIGDISPKTQAALLRVLQFHEFERVGGTETVEVDVRVIAATNRDLEGLVQTEDFRQDLYYRLCSVTIVVPPLRARAADLAALSAHLLSRIATDTATPHKELSSDALSFLRSHRWPGNVRELENVLRSAAVLSEGATLEPRDFRMYAEHLDDEALDMPAPIEPSPREGGLARLFYDRIRDGDGSIYELRKFLERDSIARALEETGGNVTQAAKLLGMKRPRLSQLIKEHGLGK